MEYMVSWELVKVEIAILLSRLSYKMLSILQLVKIIHCLLLMEVYLPVVITPADS